MGAVRPARRAKVSQNCGGWISRSDSRRRVRGTGKLNQCGLRVRFFCAGNEPRSNTRNLKVVSPSDNNKNGQSGQPGAPKYRKIAGVGLVDQIRDGAFAALGS